jgi:hypothetical protein
MARPELLDLPLELLTTVCQLLDLHDLMRIGSTCKRLRHGDDALETAELPNKSPVVTVLQDHAFSRPEMVPSTRPIGCSKSSLRYYAFYRPELIPTTRPIDYSESTLGRHSVFRPKLIPSRHPLGYSESWVSYLARCTRQRRCREAPPIAAGECHTLFVDATGRLLGYGKGAAAGHDHKKRAVSVPTPVAAVASVRVRSLAAGS